MLEKTAEKQSEVKGIEAKLQGVERARLEKEDEMKELERRLVELLVDQQKKLLSVIKKGQNVSAMSSLSADTRDSEDKAA